MSPAAYEYLSIQKTSIVRPLNPSPIKTCKLCPSDLQLLGVNYIRKALLYTFTEVSDDDMFQQTVESLKDSLAKTLVHFYPLAGRLAISSDQALFIDCSDQGAEFIEACAQNVYVDELAQDEVGPVVGQLFAINGALNIHGLHLPLLIVQVEMDNDNVKVTLSRPQGSVTDIEYGGISNLLETLNLESHRGYWDLNWNVPGGPLLSDTIEGMDFKVIVEAPDQVELSFVRTWNPSLTGTSQMPINIDKRFF